VHTSEGSEALFKNPARAGVVLEFLWYLLPFLHMAIVEKEEGYILSEQ